MRQQYCNRNVLEGLEKELKNLEIKNSLKGKNGQGASGSWNGDNRHSEEMRKTFGASGSGAVNVGADRLLSTAVALRDLQKARGR